MQGINFDIGLPLIDSKDFELYYVDWLPEQTTKLNNWLKDEFANPIAVTGQIGCGKTTFINKAFSLINIKADLKIQLNDISVISKGSFYGLFLGEILPFAKEYNIDLQQYSLEVLYENFTESTDEFIELLKPSVNLKILKKQELIFEKIDKDISVVKKVITDICKNVEAKLNRKLFIYADGVDKFNNHSAGYLLLTDLLDFLANYKTLYETNIVHVFCNDNWRKETEQIILTTPEKAKVLREMLKKRLGIYAEDFEKQIPTIYKLSGGNFRQALRLLIAYEFSVRKLNKSKNESIEYAQKIVRQDLLSSYSMDNTLLKVINKDEFILDNTIQNEKSANKAIYSNQIFLLEEKNSRNEWRAIVNPLLIDSVKSHADYLNKPDKDEDYFQLAKFQLNNIFNSLASYFLNKGKNEINVIVHDNMKIAHIVNDYLVGRASAYQEFLYTDIDITNKNIDSLLVSDDSNNLDGQSCFFMESLSQNNIDILEINRNRLIEKNMIWWISKKHINNYIKEWQHLRQFMHFFDLEKDILNNIYAEDIAEDIEDLELLDYSKEEYEKKKARLERVLNYINTHSDAR